MTSARLRLLTITLAAWMLAPAAPAAAQASTMCVAFVFDDPRHAGPDANDIGDQLLRAQAVLRAVFDNPALQLVQCKGQTDGIARVTRITPQPQGDRFKGSFAPVRSPSATFPADWNEDWDYRFVAEGECEPNLIYSATTAIIEHDRQLERPLTPHVRSNLRGFLSQARICDKERPRTSSYNSMANRISHILKDPQARPIPPPSSRRR